MSDRPANTESPNRAPSTDSTSPGCVGLAWLLLCDALITLAAYWAGHTAEVATFTPMFLEASGGSERGVVSVLLWLPFVGLCTAFIDGIAFVLPAYLAVLAYDFLCRVVAENARDRKIFTALFAIVATLFLPVMAVLYPEQMNFAPKYYPEEAWTYYLHWFGIFLIGFIFAAVSAWLLRWRRNKLPAPPRSLS